MNFTAEAMIVETFLKSLCGGFRDGRAEIARLQC